MGNELKMLLESVKDGTVSVDDAYLLLREQPFKDLGYANVDLHRKIRQGQSEVIYGAGKTADQIRGIVRALLDAHQNRILITRLDDEKAEVVKAEIAGEALNVSANNEANYKVEYDPTSRVMTIGDFPKPDGIGRILVATAGTSDIPVAEEAAITAKMLGNEVACVYDVGVAGLHRTLSHLDEIMTASVVIAVAGMEGALASLLGGLVSCPLIAVPTSVGYGASFGGVAALLSMLNSCASGVGVVNIDNGFGAGYLASQINHMEVKS